MSTNLDPLVRFFASAYPADVVDYRWHRPMDQFTRLKLAVSAARPGVGPASLAALVRADGVGGFDELFGSLSLADQAQVSHEADRLMAKGVSAALLGSPGYPPSLQAVAGAPPFLFFAGPEELLTAPGVGVCGSRDVSDEGLRAARACGEIATEHDLTLISGYARGVDMTTHIAALASGGTTVVVLPEGIDHFRVKRGEFADAWDPKRILVVSQFAPARPWSASSAMGRNKVIIGLALALVVVEARERGGTIAAGSEALRLNRRVIALEFAEVAPGNAALLDRGAVSARNRSDLAKKLLDVVTQPGGNQLLMI